MLSEIVFGLIGMTVAMVFFSVPVLKLAPVLGWKVIPLIVVVLIGVAMMVYEFFETVRDSRDESED